jgi:hypothetical protein
LLPEAPSDEETLMNRTSRAWAWVRKFLYCCAWMLILSCVSTSWLWKFTLDRFVVILGAKRDYSDVCIPSIWGEPHHSYHEGKRCHMFFWPSPSAPPADRRCNIYLGTATAPKGLKDCKEHTLPDRAFLNGWRLWQDDLTGWMIAWHAEDRMTMEWSGHWDYDPVTVLSDFTAVNLERKTEARAR